LLSCNVLHCELEESLKTLKSEFEVLDVIFCNSNITTVDLYVNIKKLHRVSFANNQRIIFVVTEDTDSSGSAGQILQNLQLIINDIDISNFFVCLLTTNANILQDYQYVLDNISQDQIPFHLYQCHGDYKTISKDYVVAFSKYTSIKDVSEQIGQLRKDQKDLLFHSKTFCMLAWAGINIEPDNRVRPCCEFKQSVGYSNKDSLDVIWNSMEWKKIRKQMLNGESVSSCQSCYDKENMGRDTLRKSANRLLSNKIDLIDRTHNDGYLEVFNLHYWDVRYNNLCNLTCRSCGPIQSSSWYNPAMILGKIPEQRSPILIAGRTNHDIFDQIVNHIDHVEQIYFAGGEPSMIDKFYEILELLDSAGRNDVKLCYNINMSRLTLKNKSLLQLWKKFPNVSIGASLDGENQRGEYLRQGLSWQDVVKNRQMMIDHCPHIDFYVSATISILNALHLPEFHKSWVDQDLIKPEDFNIQILFNPEYLRIDRAPAELKKEIKTVYQKHLKWLISNDPLGRATYGFQSVLSYIEKDSVFDAASFWNNINPLDEYHKTNMLEIFPELKCLSNNT
jgi:MoaA/NifB/PqqE/SkfB family radical SAM enzyme